MVKYCPFKKKITNKDKYGRSVDNTDKIIAITETSFLCCDEEGCMAYSNGEC